MDEVASLPRNRRVSNESQGTSASTGTARHVSVSRHGQKKLDMTPSPGPSKGTLSTRASPAPASLRPPRVVVTKNRKGAALRQALQEKTVQDLVYRTEYLATLVSEAATVDTQPNESLQHELGASCMPFLLDATATSLQSKHDSLLGKDARIAAKDAFRPPRANLPEQEVFSHIENQKLRLDNLHSAGMQELPERHVRDIDNHHLFHQSGTETSRRVHRETARKAFTVADPATCVDALQCRSSLNEVLDCSRTMVRNHILPSPRMVVPELAAAGSNPLDVVALTNSFLEGAPVMQARDHLHVAEAELRGHSDKCRHVEHLEEGWQPDPSVSGLAFARFFWQKNRALEESAATAREATLLVGDPFSHGNVDTANSSTAPCRLRRIDGEDEFSGQRFSLMEGGTVVLRTEVKPEVNLGKSFMGSDTLSHRALVVAERPVPVVAKGHYFEVQILSVFKTKGPPERPKELEQRGRSEGLVIGFTATNPRVVQGPKCWDRPGSESARIAVPLPAVHANNMPMSWSVSMSGGYYTTAESPSRPARVMQQNRIQEPRSWNSPRPRTFPGIGGTPKCQWPPPEDASQGRRRLRWYAHVGEGDRIGLLATTFGGLVIFQNGLREMMIPDASVKVDTELYPLVEVYNHIRSVRVVIGATPPT
eukprot:TRINITY_DN39667_c0_g1_i1.p1 TRINITY_DN39667_c0_g1~~TRINITY_DN39667_c0_g1_i1.p1  ORF type:complete len:652 (-),score=96.92 TRINITY_DN39667_c0_g1_i1:77-2032(-)